MPSPIDLEHERYVLPRYVFLMSICIRCPVTSPSYHKPHRCMVRTLNESRRGTFDPLASITYTSEISRNELYIKIDESCVCGRRKDFIHGAIWETHTSLAHRRGGDICPAETRIFLEARSNLNSGMPIECCKGRMTLRAFSMGIFFSEVCV